MVAALTRDPEVKKAPYRSHSNAKTTANMSPAVSCACAMLRMADLTVWVGSVGRHGLWRPRQSQSSGGLNLRAIFATLAISGAIGELSVCRLPAGSRMYPPCWCNTTPLCDNGNGGISRYDTNGVQAAFIRDFLARVLFPQTANPMRIPSNRQLSNAQPNTQHSKSKKERTRSSYRLSYKGTRDEG